jgi:hypothetical protein
VYFERDTPPAPLPRLGWALLAAVPTGWAWAGLIAALLGLVTSEGVLVFPVLALLGTGTVIALAGARVTRVAVIRVAEVTLFVVVPAWGFVLDLYSPLCDHGCEDDYQPVAWPGLAFVYVAYGAGLVAWATHRWRPDPLRLSAELGLQVGLLAGAVVSYALALQFGPRALLGLAFAPAGLPLAAPWATGALFTLALWRRAAHAERIAVGAVVTTAAWLGLDLALHRALTGELGLWGGAFSKTCGWTMSTLEPPAEDCHYLCTVAAQGHPWLVRPLRLGRRRGHVIVVNRQLAVANAFEDLLHERWPRLGRAARRTYDALAFPVSRWLLHPVAADLVFVAMLPAQLGFELVLAALDTDPEARIDRMYR